VLAALDSSAITLAIVVGMPVAVAAAAVLATLRRTGPALIALATVAAMAVVGVSAWAVYHGPAQTSAAAAPAGPIAPPAGGPTIAPSGPPPAGGPTTAPSGSPTNSCRPNGTELTETASHISYEERCLAAPAGRPFTITFTNADQGTMHNLHIFSADPMKEPNATSFFTGEIVTGPATVTYRVDPLSAGAFFFHCDIHPTLMFGTFVVR
jgi:plastocyanin